MRRLKLVLLMTLLFMVLISCSSLPEINSFSVEPMKFCRVPQKVKLNWNATGTTFSILPEVGDVVASGSREVDIRESTIFTLRARNDSGSAEQSVTASVLSGNDMIELTCLGRCVSGFLTCRVEVGDTTYSNDVVVKMVHNKETGPQITVQGGGRPSVTVPVRTSTDLFNGAPAVGSWDLMLLVSPPCTPTRGTAEAGLAITIEVGCP